MSTPTVHRKVKGSVSGAAIATLIVAVLNMLHVHIDGTEAGLISAVAALIAGYFTPNAQESQ